MLEEAVDDGDARQPPASTVELDSLIRSPFGAGEQRQRLGKAERLGRLEVDDQLILVGACTGRSARFDY